MQYAPWHVGSNQREFERAALLRKVHERRLTQAKAAELLGLSLRQVERLYRRYRCGGPSGIVSRKRGAKSNLAAEGGAFLGAMYGEEEKAKNLGLHDLALLEHRQQYIRPIVQNFKRWLDAVKPTLLPSEPLAAAVGYYKNHSDALGRLDALGKSPIATGLTGLPPYKYRTPMIARSLNTVALLALSERPHRHEPLPR